MKYWSFKRICLTGIAAVNEDPFILRSRGSGYRISTLQRFSKNYDNDSMYNDKDKVNVVEPS